MNILKFGNYNLIHRFWLFSERPWRIHGIINIELLLYCNPKPVLQIAIDDQFYCIRFLSFIKQKITCALPMRIKSGFVQKNRCGNLDMFRWNFLKLCIHFVHFVLYKRTTCQSSKMQMKLKTFISVKTTRSKEAVQWFWTMLHVHCTCQQWLNPVE